MEKTPSQTSWTNNFGKVGPMETFRLQNSTLSELESMVPLDVDAVQQETGNPPAWKQARQMLTQYLQVAPDVHVLRLKYILPGDRLLGEDPEQPLVSRQRPAEPAEQRRPREGFA